MSRRRRESEPIGRLQVVEVDAEPVGQVPRHQQMGCPHRPLDPPFPFGSDGGQHLGHPSIRGGAATEGWRRTVIVISSSRGLWAALATGLGCPIRDSEVSRMFPSGSRHLVIALTLLLGTTGIVVATERSGGDDPAVPTTAGTSDVGRRADGRFDLPTTGPATTGSSHPRPR